MSASEGGNDREILTLVWVARALERACADLTLPQYRLLALIVRGEERASGLAGQLALARPTVSAAVETLVTNGLVERTSVDGDRRAIRLTITPAGRAALRVAERAMREKLDALLADVRDPSVVEDALAQLAGALAAQGSRSERPNDVGASGRGPGIPARSERPNDVGASGRGPGIPARSERPNDVGAVVKQ